MIKRKSSPSQSLNIGRFRASAKKMFQVVNRVVFRDDPDKIRAISGIANPRENGKSQNNETGNLSVVQIQPLEI